MTSLFPTLLSLGLAAALLWAALAEGRQQARRALPAARLVRLEAVLACGAAGLVGGRLGYVGLHWSLYADHPLQSLFIWQGGLTGWAAAIGALLGAAGYVAIRQEDAWQLADHLILPATLVTFSVWLGCLADGCAYGQPVEPPWGWSSPDAAGTVRPRWPTQALGALSTVALMIPLHRGLRRPGLQPGMIAGLGMSALSAAVFSLSLVQADPAPYWGQLRIQTLAWGLLMILALTVTLIRWRSQP